MSSHLARALLVLVPALFACEASVNAQAGGSVAAAPSPAPAADEMIAPGGAPTIHGNQKHVLLQAGSYSGDLVLHGNDHLVEGAGPGQTVIDGRLLVHGNGHRVRGMTVGGPSEVHGTNNIVAGIDFGSGVTMHGVGNSQ